MPPASHDDQTATRPRRPASIAPSISSVLSDATTITAPIHEQRGFKSREAYLAALNEFAESKLYMPAGNHTLHGWYGGETMDDCKKRLGVGEKKKTRSKGAKKTHPVGSERRATMAVVPEASEESAETSTPVQIEGAEDNTQMADQPQTQGRLRRLSRVFSSGKERRSSIV